MDNHITNRACKKCGTLFPETEEYFPAYITRSGKRNLRFTCRSCWHKRINERYKENPEKVRSRQKKWENEHPEFKEWKKEYRKQYRSENLEFVQKINREWKENNSEHWRERDRQYREQNRERDQERQRRWAEEKPEKRRAAKLRRRAREYGLPNTLTDDDVKAMMEYWNNSCAICGRTSGNGLIIALDHWIPLSDKRDDNPGTVVTNMIPLCHSKAPGLYGCNSTKSSKDPVIWLKQEYDENKVREILARVNVYFEWVKTNNAGL